MKGYSLRASAYGNDWLDRVFFFAALAFVISYQWFFDGLLGNDGYFHIRFAEMMREQGTIRALPSLPFSVHAEHYRDHHWLSHILQIPFTFFPDLVIGAKASASFYAAGAVASFYFVARLLKVEHPGLWTALLVVSSWSFLYRLEMPRVQSQSLIFLLWGCYFLLKERRFALAITAAGYVWLYDGFSLLLIMGVLWGVSVWLTSQRLPWQTLAALALGTGLAIVINPYFPQNLQSYWFNFERVFAHSEDVRMGREWRPPGLHHALSAAWTPIAALVVGLAGALWQHRSWRPVVAAPVLWALAMLGLYAGALRWIEYATPFCILAAAMALRGVRLPPAWITAALILVCLVNAKTIARETELARPVSTFRGLAQWLERNTQPGEVVFNVDWDRFPLLFYHNRSNRYVAGLDPNYLYYYDPELYRLWDSVGKGKSLDLVPLLKRFDSRYLLVSRRGMSRVWRTARRSGLELVYSDEDGRIYRVPGANDVPALHWGL